MEKCQLPNLIQKIKNNFKLYDLMKNNKNKNICQILNNCKENEKNYEKKEK